MYQKGSMVFKFKLHQEIDYNPFLSKYERLDFQRLKDILQAFGTSETLVLIFGVRKPLQRDFENNNIYSIVPQHPVLDHISKPIEYAKDHE